MFITLPSLQTDLTGAISQKVLSWYRNKKRKASYNKGIHRKELTISRNFQRESQQLVTIIASWTLRTPQQKKIIWFSSLTSKRLRYLEAQTTREWSLSSSLRPLQYCISQPISTKAWFLSPNLQSSKARSRVSSQTINRFRTSLIIVSLWWRPSSWGRIGKTSEVCRKLHSSCWMTHQQKRSLT